MPFLLQMDNIGVNPSGADKPASSMAFLYAADPPQLLKMARLLLSSPFYDELDMVRAMHSDVEIIRINNMVRFRLQKIFKLDACFFGQLLANADFSYPDSYDSKSARFRRYTRSGSSTRRSGKT